MTRKIAPSKRRALIAMPPEQKVRIYSFQDAAAWEAAKARGYWTGDRQYVEDDWDREHDCSWLPQYDFMREMMAEKIEGYSGDYPMWGYLKKPNLRQARFYEEPVIYLVADIPRGRMVVSDYDLWHLPLNRAFCTWTEAEDEEIEKLYPTAKDRGITPEMKESWRRVLDLSDRTDPEVLRWCGSIDCLQACVDRIYLHEIVQARPFEGRVGRNRKPEPSRVPPVVAEAAPDSEKDSIPAAA